MSDRKNHEQKRKVVWVIEEEEPGVLPGAHEYPDEGQEYDWNPRKSEESDESVPSHTKNPIAVF